MNRLASRSIRRRRLSLFLCLLAAGAGAGTADAAVAPVWQSGAVSHAAGAADRPATFIDGAGNATALWLQDLGADTRVAVAVRPASTKSWVLSSPPRLISSPGEDAAGLAAAGNAKGDAVAVWVAGKTVKESHRWGPAGAWSPPRALRTASQAVANLSVSINDRRDAVIAWSETASVRASYRKLAGAFVAPVNLTTVSTTQIDHVFSGIDPLGGSYVAWDQKQWGSKGTYLGVYLASRAAASSSWIRSARTDLGYDSRVNSLAVRQAGSAMLGTTKRSGSSAAAVVVPYAVSKTSVSAGTAKYLTAAGVATSEPIVAMNSGGDAVVGYLSTSNQSTYALRLASYRRSTDGWSSPQTISSGAKQQGVSLALTFRGIAVAVWSDKPGGTLRVRSSVRRSASAPWEAPVVLDGQTSSASVRGLFERGGHFVAGWVDSPSGTGVANVGLLDTVPPKVAPGFARTLRVRVALRMSIAASDAVSRITRYNWTFWDDSPPATGRVVTHRFKRPGRYRVTLKAADAAGNQAKTRLVVQVVNWATVAGFPVIGSPLTCTSSVRGARFSWLRGAAVVHGGARHRVRPDDLGRRLSCSAFTTKQSATSRGRLVPRTCRVPRVVGMRSAPATAAIRNRGCRVSVQTVAAGASAAGTVVSTSPIAGRRVANGAVIHVRVGG